MIMMNWWLIDYDDGNDDDYEFMIMIMMRKLENSSSLNQSLTCITSIKVSRFEKAIENKNQN